MMRLNRLLSCVLLLTFAVANGEDASPPANSSVSTITDNDNANANAVEDLDLTLSKELEELLGLPLLDGETEDVSEDGLLGFQVQSPLVLTGAFAQEEARATAFHPASTHDEDIQGLVGKFLHVYQSEIDVTNLNAEVLHVLKAEVRSHSTASDSHPLCFLTKSILTNHL